jgi:hypothetical protein
MDSFKAHTKKIRLKTANQGWDLDSAETPFPIDHIHNTLGETGYIVMKSHIRNEPVHSVPINSLHSIQSMVSRKVLSNYKKKESDDPIVVAKINGKHYIFDGTHRATAAKIAGRTHINAHVGQYDNLPFDVSGKQHGIGFDIPQVEATLKKHKRPYTP